MAPEILRCKIENVPKEYNSKVDLWSIGVVFYFMLTGRYLFGKGSQYLILSEINRITRQIEDGTFFADFSPQCRDLLSKLLVIDAARRISWDAFFLHRIFDRSAEESGIHSELFGISLIQNIGVNELFQRNTLHEKSVVALRLRNTANPAHVSDMRGVRAQRKEIKSELVETISAVNESDRRNLSRNQEYIEVMKALFNHELNKYVYVTNVVKKIFPFLKKKLCRKIHYSLTELAFVFLLQKKERLSQIAAGFRGKQNVLKIKNSELNAIFVRSKESFHYMGYFVKLEKYYEYLLGLLRTPLVAKRAKNHPCLPSDLKVTRGAKSLQKKLWCLIFYSGTHKELMKDIIEVKKFKLMLYEFLKIMRLSANFAFKDKASNQVFNWVRYHHYIHSLPINTIQAETLKLENRYFNSSK